MTQLTATFTVTIKTKPDGDYYFDHDDLVRNVVPWIEGGLDDRDDIAEVTITEQPAAVSAAADRATVLRDAALHLYTALFPAVYDDMGQKAAEGVNRAVSELRRMADETATTETVPADPWSISYHQLSPARNNPAVCTCGLGPAALMHNEPPHPFNGRPKPGMPPVTGICTDCHHHETAACHQPAAGARQDGATS